MKQTTVTVRIMDHPTQDPRGIARVGLRRKRRHKPQEHQRRQDQGKDSSYSVSFHDVFTSFIILGRFGNPLQPENTIKLAGHVEPSSSTG